jgi:hypothetical protein
VVVSRITVKEAQAWAEGTKLTITALDVDLLEHMEAEVITQLSSAFDTVTWLDETTTPKLVRTIISKMYVSWVYNRQYSEDVDQGNNYAALLLLNATNLITGLLGGTIELPGLPDVAGSPVFYPTDASSSQIPTTDDPSLGPAAFSMGMVF